MACKHLEAIRTVDGFEVCGIMSRSPERANLLCKEYQIPICATSIQELFQETTADVVLIAVNELSSPDIIDKALDFPWVIFAEKPLCLELSDVLFLERKSKRLNRRLFVAMNRRHYSSTKRANDFLAFDSGRRIVEVHDQENITAVLDGGVSKTVAERWMVANSIHLIDYFTVFCRGKLDSVKITNELVLDNPFFMSATLNFSSGDTGNYVSFWNAPGPWGVKITTQNQMLEMRPLEILEHQIFPDRKRHQVDLGNDDIIAKPGLHSQLNQLEAAIKGKKHSLPDIAEYVETHKLVVSLYPNKLVV